MRKILKNKLYLTLILVLLSGMVHIVRYTFISEGNFDYQGGRQNGHNNGGFSQKSTIEGIYSGKITVGRTDRIIFEITETKPTDSKKTELTYNLKLNLKNLLIKQKAYYSSVSKQIVFDTIKGKPKAGEILKILAKSKLTLSTNNKYEIKDKEGKVKMKQL